MSYYLPSKEISTNDLQSVIDHLELTANIESGFASQFGMEELALRDVFYREVVRATFENVTIELCNY